MKAFILLVWFFSPLFSLAGISGSSGGPNSIGHGETRYKFEVCHGEANTNCRELTFKVTPSLQQADKNICVTSFGEAGQDIPCSTLTNAPLWLQRLLDEIKR